MILFCKVASLTNFVIVSAILAFTINLTPQIQQSMVALLVNSVTAGIGDPARKKFIMAPIKRDKHRVPNMTRRHGK